MVVLALLVLAGTGPVDDTAVEEPEVAQAIVIPETPKAAPEPEHSRPVSIGDASEYSPPDFTGFRDVKARKRAFYEYLLPKIHEANEEVMREREWLSTLSSQLVFGVPLSGSQADALSLIERRYLVRDVAQNDLDRVEYLLTRVDIVPASLVLAQAAKESGWGTSRFAREGNNFFGIWCFYEGCGLTPLRRTAGLSHEVAMFDSVADGVRYYIRTINTHFAYEDLRQMRADARLREEILPGTELARGLIRYSERGLAYVKEIQSMIRYNQLQRFTRSYSV
jgi:Bax protein